MIFSPSHAWRLVRHLSIYWDFVARNSCGVTWSYIREHFISLILSSKIEYKLIFWHVLATPKQVWVLTVIRLPFYYNKHLCWSYKCHTATRWIQIFYKATSSIIQMKQKLIFFKSLSAYIPIASWWHIWQ